MLQYNSENLRQEMLDYILRYRQQKSRLEIDEELLAQNYEPQEIDQGWQAVHGIRQVEPRQNLVNYIRQRKPDLTKDAIFNNLRQSGHMLYEIEVAWEAVENNWQPIEEEESTAPSAPYWLRQVFSVANGLAIMLALSSFLVGWNVKVSFLTREMNSYATVFHLNSAMIYPFGLLVVVLGLNVADYLISTFAEKSRGWLSFTHFILLSGAMVSYAIILKPDRVSYDGAGITLFNWGIVLSTLTNGWSIKNQGFRPLSIIGYGLTVFLFLVLLTLTW